MAAARRHLLLRRELARLEQLPCQPSVATTDSPLAGMALLLPFEIGFALEAAHQIWPVPPA